MKNLRLYLVLLFATSVFGSLGEEIAGNFYNQFANSKINLINSNINSTTISVEINRYELKEILYDGKKSYRVEIENGTPILNYGYPDLPKMSTSVIIPDYSNMEVVVLNYEYEDIYDIEIIPSKGNILRSINPDAVAYEYAEIYEEDSFYPEKIATLGDPYILRDVRGQGVIINPVQYNPIKKILRVYSKINIEIKESDFNVLKKNPLHRISNKSKTSKEYNNIYKNLFLNYRQDTRFDYIDDYGNMLIICYDDFASDMEPFVEWKNKKGIPTEIVLLSEVGNSVGEIQDYVNNYYYENDLTYLLLVGDVAQIPTPIISGASSDPSYGFIEGSDSFAEVIVGRFSANNPGELQTQVQRSLEYEQNPSEVSHLDSALGIASNQGPGYGGLSDDDFNDLLWNDFLSGYTYENFEGIYDPSGSVAQGMDAINAGVGVINYTGHAGPTGWGNGAPLNVNDVYQLDNSGMLPFVFTVGCNPGEFNNYGECFCEAWLRATDDDGNPIGAVAHLGSTISQSWEPPMHGQWAMNAILSEAYEGNISRTYGGISVNGCMHMNEAQGSYGINETNHWTIFGDPSIMIRTDQPNDLNVSYSDAVLVGQTEFVVDVGVENALVALSSNNELLASAISIGGVAVLDISEISLIPGELDLVVTSFNTIPYIGTLNVITPDGAFLVYEGYSLVSESNFNELIEFGEEIDINLIIENVGQFSASNINVEVISDDSYISVNNGISTIANANAGEIVTTETPISFSILNSVPDGHLAQFHVVLIGEEEWQFNFTVEIHSPVFEIMNPTIVDENNDGVWDPGETASITVDLVNSGSAAFYQYPGATISTNNEHIQILSGENDNTFYGIDPGMVYEGTFLVLSELQTPLNTEIEFDISWGYSPTSECQLDDCVQQADMVYSAIIGHPSVLIWDPSSQHISGTRIVDYFNDNNIVGYDYIETNEVPDLENYSTMFIFLGVYPENRVLTENDVQDIVSLLNDGGNVYLEGADTWAFDQSTSLHTMFGISPQADGSADLSTISGINGTFTNGMSFSYDGGNSYVDRLLPNGGFAILRNNSPEYYTAIAYEDSNQNYRTIGASHDIGGLQGDDFGAYIQGVLSFFNEGAGEVEECTPGDINDDGNIDVSDIVRQVNIIINFGAPPTELELCACDVNGDGSINVLDVVGMINIIVGRDSYRIANSYSRIEAIEEIDLIITDNNSLNIESPGVVKGVEIVVKSNAENLSFNENLNMDIAYNKIGDKHHVLIYSINQNYLEEGNTNLFRSNESIEVEYFIAANSNNDAVEYFLSKESKPKTVKLSQNYPNPFNPTTNIDIELNDYQYVKLNIYDINGHEVKELANGYYDSGEHSFMWDGTNHNGTLVSSGMYIYTMIAGDQRISQKMLFLK